jgi:hypothetical protein
MAVIMKKTGSSKSANRAPARAAAALIELPDGMWHRIATKAYELWDERGRREGFALQDWLDAEAIVMDEIHEARE